MLEFYWAYHDYEDLIELTENMLAHIANRVADGQPVVWQGLTVDFSQPAVRISMADSVVPHTELTQADVQDEAILSDYLSRINVPVDEDWGWGKLLNEVFEARVEEQLTQPTFITLYPTEISPLSRRNDEDPRVTDRFELFIGGREIANGFSELNDPVDQA